MVTFRFPVCYSGVECPNIALIVTTNYLISPISCIPTITINIFCPYSKYQRFKPRRVIKKTIIPSAPFTYP